MRTNELDTPEARAAKRLENVMGVLWHVATYVIVNGFLWAIDLAGGGGLEWAYWVTIPWGVGVAFHVAAYWIEERVGNRRYQRILDEERSREAPLP